MSLLSQIAGYFLIPKETRKKIENYQQESEQKYQEALNYEALIDNDFIKNHYLFKEYKLAFDQILDRASSRESVQKKVIEIVEKNYKLMKKGERAKDYIDMAKKRLDLAIASVEQSRKLLGDFEIDLSIRPQLDFYRMKYKQLKLVERLLELDKFLYELERKKILNYLKFLDHVDGEKQKVADKGEENLSRLYQESVKDVDREEKYLLAKRKQLENKGKQLLKQLRRRKAG